MQTNLWATHAGKVDSSHEIIVSGQENFIPFIINILWRQQTPLYQFSKAQSLWCGISLNSPQNIHQEIHNLEPSQGWQCWDIEVGCGNIPEYEEG